MSKTQRFFCLLGVLLIVLTFIAPRIGVNLPFWLFLLIFITIFSIVVDFIRWSSRRTFEGIKTDVRYIFKNGKIKVMRSNTEEDKEESK